MTDPVLISRKNLVQIIGKQFNYYPNPDDLGDPNNPFGPYGPHGPILHSVLDFQRLRRLDWVGLNPQPLPPKEMLGFSLSQAVTDHVGQIYAFADLMSAEAGDDLRKGGLQLLDEFEGWCGTMTRWEIIQALLRRRLGKKPIPPPPDPEPWWDERMDAFELITIGAQLQLGFEQIADDRLADSVNQIGSNLIDGGLSMLG